MKARACLLLGALLWPQVACAQNEQPLPGQLPPSTPVAVPFFLFTLDGVDASSEWVTPTQSLYIDERASLAQPGLPSGPLIVYRDRDMAIVGGLQLLAGATPFSDYTAMQGIRWVGGHEPWSVSVWAGRSADFDQLTVGGANQTLAGVTLGYRPDPFHTWGGSVMPYASTPNGGLDRGLVTVQRTATNETTWSWKLAAGADIGTRVPGETWDQRGAIRLSGSYQVSRFSAALDGRWQGALFGPPQALDDERGLGSATSVARYRLSDKLSLQEVVQWRSLQRQASNAPAFTTLEHTLAWTAAPGVQVAGGLRMVDSVGGSGNSGWFARASGPYRGIMLAGDVEDDLVAATQVQSRSLGAGVPLGPGRQLDVALAQNLTSGPGGQFSRSTPLTVGLRQEFGDGLGFASLEYLTSDQDVSAGGLADSLRQLTAGVDYRLGPRLWAGLSLSNVQDTSGGTTRQFQTVGGRLRLILSPHSELEISRRVQDPAFTVLLAGRPQTLGDVTLVSWHNSFGGPLERNIRQDLTGQVDFSLYASNGKRTAPAPGVKVRLGDVEATTDAQGRVSFPDLAAGPYTVTVAELPQDFAERTMERVVTVRSGRVAHAKAVLPATSSVRAVVWSDVGGQGHLPTGYQPMVDVPLVVDGLAERRSTADGSVNFDGLPPGRYTVHLGALDPAFTLTTPGTRTVTIVPGQRAVVSFGLQGFGDVQGHCTWATLKGNVPDPDVGVWVDGTTIARTDATGAYHLHIPVGHHVISLEPPAIPRNQRYLEGDPVGIDVGVGKTLDLELRVIDYAHVHGFLKERLTDGRLVPYKQTGVVVMRGKAFQYTDANGEFRYDPVAPGDMTLALDPASLPGKVRLVSPARWTRVLKPGEPVAVEFVVQRLP